MIHIHARHTLVWLISRHQLQLCWPNANDVAERFTRVLKEQVCYGPMFKNVKELPIAVADSNGRLQ